MSLSWSEFTRWMSGSEATCGRGDNSTGPVRSLEGPDPYSALVAAVTSFVLRMGAVDDAPARLLGSRGDGLPIPLEGALGPPPGGELIWCYWMEAGFLVGAMDAVAACFQGRRRREAGWTNALGRLDLGPLRPLEQLLKSYVERENDRSTPRGRSDAYAAEYGLLLRVRSARWDPTLDRRSGVLNAFHRLLATAVHHHQQSDDRQSVPDVSPVLTSLREMNLLVVERPNDGTGRLAFDARCEMLVRQYLLALPEVGTFLGGLSNTPAPEPWMDSVSAVRHLMGIEGASVVHFADLARTAERLFQSVRRRHWTGGADENDASKWANGLRDDVFAYVNAYRNVTGVDLSAPPPRAPRTAHFRATPGPCDGAHGE